MTCRTSAVAFAFPSHFSVSFVVVDRLGAISSQSPLGLADTVCSVTECRVESELLSGHFQNVEIEKANTGTKGGSQGFLQLLEGPRNLIPESLARTGKSSVVGGTTNSCCCIGYETTDVCHTPAHS